jgi:hypothetical protein
MEDANVSLSPTVSRVIAAFITEIRNDAAIDGGVADRLQSLMMGGAVPKPEDLSAAFGPHSEGES